MACVKFRNLGSWLRTTGNNYKDLSSSFLNIDLILYNCKRASQVKKFVSQERTCLFFRNSPEKNSDFPAYVACLFLGQSLWSWKQGHLQREMHFTFRTHIRILHGDQVVASINQKEIGGSNKALEGHSHPNLQVPLRTKEGRSESRQGENGDEIEQMIGGKVVS